MSFRSTLISTLAVFCLASAPVLAADATAPKAPAASTATAAAPAAKGQKASKGRQVQTRQKALDAAKKRVAELEKMSDKEYTDKQQERRNARYRKNGKPMQSRLGSAPATQTTTPTNLPAPKAQ